MSGQALRLFRDRLGTRDLAETKISYRIVGGQRSEPGLPPLPPAHEVLTIDGDGTARLRSGELIVAETRLEAGELENVFERVASNLPALVPRSEARFIPDSVVGEITIEVEGERQQLYFPIEGEEEGRPLEAAMMDELADMRSTLREVVDRVRPESQKEVPSWP